jgi:aspartate aminotransferase
VIPERIVALLEAQERFDARQARAARLGARLADLSYANFDGPLDPGVREVLQRALETDRNLAFQYTPFGGSRTARHAVADALSSGSGSGHAFGWRDVVLTNGAAAGLTIAVRALGAPGDEVVIPVPCWLDHPLYVEACGRTAVLVPLSGDTGFDLDVEALGKAVTERTTAVVLGNPANPTGRVYGAATLSHLADVLDEAEQQHGRAITLVADETHRDLAGPAFAGCADHYDRTLIVYSFGKYHSIQGQRLGYVAVAPSHPERAALRTELARWTRIAGNTTPTALMQLAVPGLLALRHDTAALDEWRVRYVTRMRSAGYEVVPPDGTHFVYVRTPPGPSDDGWAETLLRDHRLLVLPAPVFHHTGWFRLSLTATPEGLDRGLRALEEAGNRWCRASA